LPEFQWSSYAHPNTELYNLASKFICSNGLHQFVEVPTREKNILDIVLWSDVLACDNVDVSAPIGNSDHNVVSFTLNVTFPSCAATYNILSVAHNFAKADGQDLITYYLIVIGMCCSLPV